MKRQLTAVAVTFAVATAAAALAAPTAFAEPEEDNTAPSLFQLNPKAPTKDTVENKTPAEEPTRQIVVEPKEEPKNTDVANLITPVEEEVAPPPPPVEPEVTEKLPEFNSAPETGIDENVFAPKTEATQDKVEMPTVFTEKQKGLFSKLSVEQQKVLVKKLVKKYGYETMYPKKVTRKYLDDYKQRKSHAYDDEIYSGNYGHDDNYSRNTYSYNYGSSYGGGSYKNCY